MNGWLIVAASLALLVVLLRLWFRWFSQRPLSRIDEYAGTVDTAVDGPVAGPAADATVRPFASRPGLPGPPRPADDRLIPQQRTAADGRPSVGERSAADGPAGVPQQYPPGS
ncbi:MAG: hypothetical protein ABIR83_02535 [Nakamurella sp.]